MQSTTEAMVSKVEKNVPLPARKGRWRDLFSRMNVGESVVVDSMSEAESMCNSAYQYSIKTGNGFKLTRRKVANGYRVWRVS